MLIVPLDSSINYSFIHCTQFSVYQNILVKSVVVITLIDANLKENSTLFCLNCLLSTDLRFVTQFDSIKILLRLEFSTKLRIVTNFGRQWDFLNDIILNVLY